MPQNQGDTVAGDDGRDVVEIGRIDGVGSIHVLHVDDEPDFASMAAEFVQRQDDHIDVRTAERAAEALAELESNSVDCVVSDYDMPGRNGIEFLETVREDHPDLPFILFTGKGSEEIASRAISAGVTDYLQKGPGTNQFTVLANRIRNLVGKHRAERESERLRVQKQAITQNINDAIVTIDSNSTITFANQATEALVGYRPSELEGMSLTQLMPDRFRRAHTTGLNRYLASGQRRIDWNNPEFHVLHRDGHEVPVSVSFGEFELRGQTQFVGVIRDITEPKRRLAQLRENETELRMYERAVESSTDLLAAVDTEYTFLFANARYREFHGLTRDEIGTRTLPDVLDEAWERGVKDQIDRALAGEEVRYEMERRGADGKVRTFDLRNYPLRAGDGRIIGTVGAMRDITRVNERDREP